MQSSDGERQKKQQMQALDYDCKKGKPDEDDVSGWVDFLRKQTHHFRFLSLNLFLRRHFEISSDLLFRRDFWSACRINSFSAKQSGHLRFCIN